MKNLKQNEALSNVTRAVNFEEIVILWSVIVGVEESRTHAKSAKGKGDRSLVIDESLVVFVSATSLNAVQLFVQYIVVKNAGKRSISRWQAAAVSQNSKLPAVGLTRYSRLPYRS